MTAAVHRLVIVAAPYPQFPDGEKGADEQDPNERERHNRARSGPGSITVLKQAP